MVDLEENMFILERKKKLKGRDACRCHDLVVIRQLAEHGLDDRRRRNGRATCYRVSSKSTTGAPCNLFLVDSGLLALTRSPVNPPIKRPQSMARSLPPSEGFRATDPSADTNKHAHELGRRPWIAQDKLLIFFIRKKSAGAMPRSLATSWTTTDRIMWIQYNRATKKKRKKEEMASLLLATLSKQLLDRAL